MVILSSVQTAMATSGKRLPRHLIDCRPLKPLLIGTLKRPINLGDCPIIEWKKAARGVDMRRYPWGNHHDPSWCNMLESSSYNPLVNSVHSYSNDTSVYGMLGVAGNVSDWCSNGYSPNFVPVRSRRINPDVFPVSQKIIRGGSWAKRERDGMCEIREYRSQDDQSQPLIQACEDILPEEYHHWFTMHPWLCSLFTEHMTRICHSM